MILADTSVWISHFRYGERKLSEDLELGLVLMHPYICGELACGTLKDRESILDGLQTLPPAEIAHDAEVLNFIDRHKLSGRGLGWIDIHLLVATRLSECRLWTLDKRLNTTARTLGLT